MIPGLIFCAAAFSQSSAVKPAFDAVAIKPAPPISQVPLGQIGIHGGPGTADPERFQAGNVTLRGLINQAYGPLPLAAQIDGVPLPPKEWTVVAKVPAGASKEQLRLMLQVMLEDRFRLKVHHETRTVPGYNLVLANGGLKLKDSVHIRIDLNAPGGIADSSLNKARSTDDGPYDFGGAHSVRPHSMFDIPEGTEKILVGNAVTTSQLAVELTAETGGTPVAEKTGLTGAYDIFLPFAARFAEDRGEATRPGLMPSLEHDLGLKLEPAKVQIDVLVVDHVDPAPTDN